MADETLTYQDIVSLYNTQSDIRREAEENAAKMQAAVALSQSTLKDNITNEATTTRRDNSRNFIDTTRDILSQAKAVNDDLKKGQWDSSMLANSNADKIMQRTTDYFLANQNRQFDTTQQIAALKSATDLAQQRSQQDLANVAAANSAAIQLASAQATAASALAAEKIVGAVTLGQSETNYKILTDGGETRRLINELKVSDLQRQLVERNAEIVEHRGESRHLRGLYEGSQMANLASQIQNIGSQVSETRQGMVNFGTMAGVGQTSSNTKV